MNHRAPTIRAQIQTHKINYPIRPVINGIQNPREPTSKFLLCLLNKLLFLEENLTLCSRKQLVDLLHKQMFPDGCYLLSLDIKNLYTNVPLEQTISIIQKDLSKQENLLPDKSAEIVSLL